MNTTNFLLILLGSCLILCFILMLMDNTEQQQIDGFDPVIDAIQSKLQSETPEQLKSTVQALQQRLIDYGYAPDVNTFVKRTELGPNDGKCLVANAQDRDKYVSKSDIPLQGPRIDLSQYVKKSSIPPQTVCPPQQEIDYSAYVKKSTLPPNEKCPVCISPKVKVSAGLCRNPPPCPTQVCPAPVCPAPVCPQVEPCPAEKQCPPPAKCDPPPKCQKCDEIRYIKVPALITKTIIVDKDGNVISQKIDSGNTNPTVSATSTTSTTAQQIYNTPTQMPTQMATQIPPQMPPQMASQIVPQIASQIAPQRAPQLASQIASQMVSQNNKSFLNSIFGSSNDIPTTTFPVMSSQTPNTTLAQTLDNNFGSKKAFCPSSDLNSEFKSYGIYGPQ
jgi:hypothetical protein